MEFYLIRFGSWDFKKLFMKPILKIIACALLVTIAFSVYGKNTLVVKIGNISAQLKCGTG